MFTLGPRIAGRVRPCCRLLPRPRLRNGVLRPTYIPLGRRLVVEASRGRRATADADDDGEAAAAAGAEQDSLGPPPPPGDASEGDYWQAVVRGMGFKELQAELKRRGQAASGKRADLEARLAPLLAAEHGQAVAAERAAQQAAARKGAAAGRGAAAAQQQQQQQEAAEGGGGDDDAAALVEAVLDALEEVAFQDLRRMATERGLSGTGKKADLQLRLAEAIVAEGGEELAELLGLDEGEEEAESAAPARAPPPKPEPAKAPRPAEAKAGAGADAEDEAEADEGEDLLSQLLALSKAELVSALREYGAPVSGSKPQLAERLAELMTEEAAREAAAAGEGGEAGELEEGEFEEYEEAEEGEYEEGEYEEEEAAPRRPAAATPSAAAPAPARAPPPPRPFDPASVTDSDRKLLLAHLAAERRALHEGRTRQELYRALRESGHPAVYTSRGALMDTLVRHESERALEAVLQDAAADPAAGAELMALLRFLRNPSQAGAPAAAAPAPRAEAPQREAAAAAEEEEEAAGAGAPAAPAAAPTIDYRRLSAIEVRRLRVEELRVALGSFGVESEGLNKWEMVEALLGQLARSGGPPPRTGRPSTTDRLQEAGGGGAAAERAAERVAAMGLRELRRELDGRGLATGGSRGEMQERLVQALCQEEEEAARQEGEAEAPAGGPASPALSVADHLAALAALPLEARGAAVVAAIASDPASLVVLGREAPVDVAVVAGCPPGRLDLAEQSLAAARTLLDTLYTAHLDTPASRLATPVIDTDDDGDGAASSSPSASAAAAAEAAGGKGEGEQAGLGADALDAEVWDAEAVSAAPVAGGVARPSTGVVVGVWWVDGATGAATLLSPAQVHAATAAELAAGCLPAVHRDLLAVPPPSPLSLRHPELEGPVPPLAAAAAGGGGGGGPPTGFADVASLAAHLKSACHVAFPAVAAGTELYGEVAAALEAARVPAVGSGAAAAAAVVDRVEALRRLSQLHYPVVPHLELTPQHVAAQVAQAAAAADQEAGADGSADDDRRVARVVAAAEEALRARLEAWCTEQGLHPAQQLLLVRPRVGCSGEGVGSALGAARAARLAAGLLARAALEAGPAGQAEGEAEADARLVVEAAAPGGAARFVCSVVETPDGPVALLPAEVEVYDTEMELVRHAADMAEWQALKDGADEEEIAALRSSVLARELPPWVADYDPRVTGTLPPTCVARLHTPPRLSRKLTHAVRHAAAAAFSALGLRDCATLAGWVELPAGYAAAMEAAGRDEDGDVFPTLYDEDPAVLAKLAAQEAERLAADPAPLEDYYDIGASWHADLSLFDPAVRLRGSSNGEGATIVFSCVAPDLPLQPRHPAVLAAAEVGLTHGSLLRNLANAALRRAAEAGDERALTPLAPYVAPPEAVEAAAAAAEAKLVEEAAAADAAAAEAAEAAVDAWFRGADGNGEEEEDVEEELCVDEDGGVYALRRRVVGEAGPDDEYGEVEVEEEEEGEALHPEVAAAAAAAAAPVELPPAPLQLPMPPQLPLYHTAVCQHLREADEFDEWIEEHDPDHWDDTRGLERAIGMAETYEMELERETGLPRGVGDCPAPLLDDMVSGVVVDGERAALDAAVEALGDFGSRLSAAMGSLPLEDALDADAEIALTRTRPLPPPGAVLGGGVDGTAADPRVTAAWQLAAIAELARRHGWELVEAADAEEEAREAEEARRAAGLAPPTPEEEAAAAREAASEQALLEGLCDTEDEVMELRTGLITPVQLYLRFRARQARRPPSSHPLVGALAAIDGEAEEGEEEAEEAEEEAEEGVEEEEEAEEGVEEEGRAATAAQGARRGAVGRASPSSSEAEEAEEVAAAASAPADGADADAAAEEEGEEEEEVFEPFGPASTGPGTASPSTYHFYSPPDDAVELDVPSSAALVVTDAAVAELAAGRDGGLAAEVGRSGRQALSAAEHEALGAMELGYRPELLLIDGVPKVALRGPAPEGLTQEVVVDAWGRLADLPSFAPLAAVMADEGVGGGAGGASSPSSSSSYALASTTDSSAAAAEAREAEWDWEDEDAFPRGVSAALAEAGDVGGGGGEDGEEEGGGGLAGHPAAPLIAEALAAGDLEAAELAALAPPLNPTRVWVVVGGDGHWGREAGLAAGLNVVNKLAKYQDLVVEPFLLVPPGEGRNEEARRSALLARRAEFLSGVGMAETDLSPAMSPGALRAPQQVVTGRPETIPVYAVPLPTLLRPSVPEALLSVERTAAREGVALHALSAMQRQQRVAHCDVQAELAAAGLEGVASLWDGDVTGQVGPPPARPLDLMSFAEAAAGAGAVVVVAGRGELAECGVVQTVLELQGVPFVGTGSEPLSELWNKANAQDLLQNLSEAGVTAPPRIVLPTADFLVAATFDEDDADKMLLRLRHGLLEEEAADALPAPHILVRPAADTAGTAVARLATPADLVTYARALRAGAAVLPPDTLSYPHGPIPLPPRPPASLAFEPFIESDTVLMVVSSSSSSEGGDGEGEEGGGGEAEIQVVRRSGWVEVSFTLVGPQGNMTCLPPAVRAAVVGRAALAEALAADEAAEAAVEGLRAEAEAATPRVEAAAEAAHAAAEAEEAAEAAESDDAEHLAEAAETAEYDLLAAVEAAEAAVEALRLAPSPAAVAALAAHCPRALVCPPPLFVLGPEATEAACGLAAEMAGRLGLRGVATVDAFVSCDSGELIVTDINGVPDLGPDSVIYRQAAAAGLLPADLLRELLGLALEARADAGSLAATMGAQLEAAAYDGSDEVPGSAAAEEGEDEGEGGEGEEGGTGFGAGDEEEDMLGELEELRMAPADDEEGDGDAYEEDEEEDFGGDRRMAGLGADVSYGSGAGGEGYLDFDDDEEEGGPAGVGAGGGGYMRLDEFGRGGRGGGGGSSGRGRGGGARRGGGGGYGGDDDDFDM